jgi:NAD(P)-dependent dehydrogenase (short-subunit alcohol dehydrogenase family)
VTGGASGIGLATANLFLEAGALVAVVDFKGLDKLPINESLLLVPCDVTKLDQVKSAVETVMEKWSRIDVLVNNAGVADSFGKFFSFLRARETERLIRYSPTQPELRTPRTRYGSGP